MNGAYNGKGIEFSNYIENLKLHEGNFINNYYVDPYFSFKNEMINAVLLSKDWPGKTCLHFRLLENYYWEDQFPTSGGSFRKLEFEFDNNKYEIGLWDTISSERYRNFSFNLSKKAQIAIYLIDLTYFIEIDENFIKEIKSRLSEEALIYLVGTKL